MRQTGSSRLISVVTLALSVAFLFSTATVGETAQPYCQPGERFAPDGRIVELGGRYFHICGAKGAGFPYTIDPQLGKLAVRISNKSSKTREVEAAIDTPKYLWGFMFYDDGIFDTVLGNLKSPNKISVGEISLGSARYTVLSNDGIMQRHQGAVEKGNLPRSALYIFDRPEGSDIPAHLMTCMGDPTAVPRTKHSCTIYLQYRESDDHMIDHGIIWSPSSVGRPMDFERLPDLVRAVHALFEHVDVTDRLDTLEGVPIVRTPE